MWGVIDNWRQWAVFVAVLVVAVCAALALHYLLIKILGGFARRSNSKVLDLLVRHLRQPVLWVMILIAVSLAAELSVFSAPVKAFAVHLFAILLIALVVWLLTRAMCVLSDIILLRFEVGAKDNLRARTVYTRVSADLLGTVLLYTDYTVPVEAVRAELLRILDETELWDRKVGLLQVTDASDRTLELRALVSAPNAGTAWDLRCHIREKLIEFIQKNYPHALPRLRADIEKPEDLNGDAL